MHWTDEQAQKIWASLNEIGVTKAAGYLPLHTVETLLGKTREDVARTLSKRGICVWILDEDRSPIESGAVFAFQRIMAERIIARHQDILREKNWPSDVDRVMTEIAAAWFEVNDPAMPLIRELYNNG